MFQIKGIVRVIYETQTFGKGFTKREFILSVRRGEKVEDIKFECHGDKANDLLDNLVQGDLIEVEFCITGREWNGKFYNNLVCYGIEYEQSEAAKEVTSLTEEEQEEVDGEVPF